MTVTRAANEIATLRRLFRLLTYPVEVLEVWQRIVINQEISGKQTHDAHLAAIMEVNAVSKVLTFNADHFARFPSITVLDPAHL